MSTLTYSERNPHQLSLAIEIKGVSTFINDCLAYLIMENCPSEVDLPLHTALSKEVNELLLSEIQGVRTDLRDMGNVRLNNLTTLVWGVMDGLNKQYFPTGLRVVDDYIVINLEEDTL